MALRLAVILCHARREPDMKGLTLRATNTAATTGCWAAATAGRRPTRSLPICCVRNRLPG